MCLKNVTAKTANTCLKSARPLKTLITLRGTIVLHMKDELKETNLPKNT